MTDGLIDVLIFKVGHFYVSFGMLGASVHDDGENLRVREGCQCLGHDRLLETITVRCFNIPFYLFHRPVEIVRGYWSKIKDAALLVTEPALEVGIGFDLGIIGCGMFILTFIPL